MDLIFNYSGEHDSGFDGRNKSDDGANQAANLRGEGLKFSV